MWACNLANCPVGEGRHVRQFFATYSPLTSLSKLEYLRACKVKPSDKLFCCFGIAGTRLAVQRNRKVVGHSESTCFCLQEFERRQGMSAGLWSPARFTYLLVSSAITLLLTLVFAAGKLFLPSWPCSEERFFPR